MSGGTSAKDLIVRPIGAAQANALVRRVHYSGKVVQNSQAHMGVFWQGRLEGAMQFGPSLDKRKLVGLVAGTRWNEFIELNRMAFTDVLPRNSESRAIAVAMRILRKHAPHLRWVVSFADGAQCGDGTIYRASGFVLTGIRKNNQVWVMPDGEAVTRLVSVATRRPERKRLLSRVTVTKGKHITDDGGASMRPFIEAGAKPLPGYQLRYIYFLDPSCRERLTVPVLPFSEIGRLGAGMYRGQPTSITRATSIDSDAPGHPAGNEGGASPTVALHEHEPVAAGGVV